MNIPKNLLYTKDHEWARIEGKTAYVGITDYAQGSLGDITFVELPKAGAALQQSKQSATVESVKAASEVYAPLSGKVLSVNEELSAHPELVNQFPYEKGFFFTMEISSDAEKANLLSADDYLHYVESITK